MSRQDKFCKCLNKVRFILAFWQYKWKRYREPCYIKLEIWWISCRWRQRYQIDKSIDFTLCTCARGNSYSDSLNPNRVLSVINCSLKFHLLLCTLYLGFLWRMVEGGGKMVGFSVVPMEANSHFKATIESNLEPSSIGGDLPSPPLSPKFNLF